MSAWRFVPSPLTSTPIIRRSTPRRPRRPRARPITRSPGTDVARLDDRAVPDAQVEHAAQLVLPDALVGEPREDRGALPGGRLDDRADAVREDAREIAGDPPAGDVRERADVGPRPERAHVVEVATRRREQQVGIELVVPDDAADEREAVRVDARGGQPEDDVAGLCPRPVDELGAGDDADDGPAEVDLLVAVDPGKLRRLAAEDRAAGGAADVGGAFHELRDLIRVDDVRGDVVEEEERLGARREDVVDPVRGKVGPAPAELSGPARQHELGADGVRRRGQQPVLVDREEPGERTEIALDAWRPGGVDGRAQAADDGLRRRERHSRGRVRLVL